MDAITHRTPEQLDALKSECLRIANSGLVPEHFAKNPQSIAVAIDMARALGEAPVMLMRGIFFISGRAGFTAEYMLSRLRRLRVIRGTVAYQTAGSGDGLSVRACAVDAETGDRVHGPTVSMEMARADGWTKNPKYKSMPEVMLRKRAVTFLVRDHYPDVLGGFHTTDELQDIEVRSAPSAERVNLLAELNGDDDVDDVSDAGDGADEGDAS